MRLHVAVMFLMVVGMRIQGAEERIVLQAEVRSDELLPSFKGDRLCNVLAIRARLLLEDGKTELADAISIYDPLSKLLWWTVWQASAEEDLTAAKARFFRETRCFIEREQIACFGAMERASIFARISSAKAETQQQSRERLIQGWTDALANFPSWVFRSFKRIETHKLPGWEKLIAVPLGGPVPSVTITKLEKKPSGWEVVVQSSDGQVASFLLNSRVEAVRATKVQ